MENQNASEPEPKSTAAKRSDRPKASRKRPRSDQTEKSTAKSKKDQLIGLLSKPSGARVSVLGERLGWQPHTVRAALSGLRKQGFEIATSKSAKTGETVYSIASQPAAATKDTGGPGA
jgi:predicted ArsR family transcriptional regulator